MWPSSSIVPVPKGIGEVLEEPEVLLSTSGTK
jgi:hypothetical protein